MYYTVYKTINLVNNKEYVGFHKINSLDDIVFEISSSGSIFEDGYLGSGKLMKRALEKYGPLNMRQELLLVTTDKDEALELEKDIVNEKWVKCEDNYNLSIGGSVTILIGDKNGFFGKKHTKFTIDKMQESRNARYKEEPYSWSKSYLTENDKITFINKEGICDHFGIVDNIKYEVCKLVYEGIVTYNSKFLQRKAIEYYIKRSDFYNDIDARKAVKDRLKKLASMRFKGIPKTKESNIKRSASIKKWISENPDAHQERMNKINKNPDKIRKTAEKHRGSKRSDETKRRISESAKGRAAHNKGKIFIHNVITQEKKLIEKDDIVPDGWHKGYGKRK